MTSDADAQNAADEAMKQTQKHLGKPIHKTRFSGSPRKLKGRSFGTWVQVSEGRWVYVRP